MLQGHEIQHHPPSETCDKQRFRTGKAWTFMVTWLYTLSCTGPVGRHTTVLSSAGCVGTVRLTSQASGLSKSLSTDTPPRYDNRQQWKVVLQESSDRWRGLTCLKPKHNKISLKHTHRSQQLPLSDPHRGSPNQPLSAMVLGSTAVPHLPPLIFDDTTYDAHNLWPPAKQKPISECFSVTVLAANKPPAVVCVSKIAAGWD